jgi:hypothetical protein
MFRSGGNNLDVPRWFLGAFYHRHWMPMFFEPAHSTTQKQLNRMLECTVRFKKLLGPGMWVSIDLQILPNHDLPVVRLLYFLQ